MSDVETVLAAALRLPVAARAAVVAELIQSLEGDDAKAEGVEDAWAQETARRLAEIDRGTVSLVPGSDAKRRILAAASGRREAP